MRMIAGSEATNVGPWGGIEARNVGPPTAVIAVLSHFDCSPLHLCGRIVQSRPRHQTCSADCPRGGARGRRGHSVHAVVKEPVKSPYAIALLHKCFWLSHRACSGLSSAPESSILNSMLVSLAQHELRVGWRHLCAFRAGSMHQELL